MATKSNENAELLKTKLAEIRQRLAKDPSKAELSSMQLQIDTLEKWARLVSSAEADHQHNHMNDHDNTAFVEPFVVLQSKK